MAVKPIPDGFHSVTPYIVVKGAGNALEFYKKAFGAVEIVRMPGPGGAIMHAEFKIGDSILMMGDENIAMGAPSPLTLGGTPIGLCIYVKDSDAVFNQAVAAGAKVLYPVKDQFYGDSILMMGDENIAMGAPSPQTLGGTPIGLCIYVKDSDAVFNQAVAAGAKVLYPVKDQFYGDRSGTVQDPFGHKWTVATHKEDVSPEEMQKRMAEFYKQQPK